MTWRDTTILTGSDWYSPRTWGWKHIGRRLLEIQKLMYETINFTISYVHSFDMIWYDRQILVHFISIDSIRHVSHHHTICTQYHLFVTPHATLYLWWLSCKGELSNNNINCQSIILCYTGVVVYVDDGVYLITDSHK